MVRKPDIQYVHEFYVHGSEAKVIELKPKRRAAKTILPTVAPDKGIKIAVDPLALCGIVVAISLLVLMVVGVFQFRTALREHQTVMNQVITLQNKNVELRQTYKNSYDLDDVAMKASALGMIPIAEAEVVQIAPVMPVAEPEPTLWDDIVWFMQGLFA